MPRANVYVFVRGAQFFLRRIFGIAVVLIAPLNPVKSFTHSTRVEFFAATAPQWDRMRRVRVGEAATTKTSARVRVLESLGVLQGPWPLRFLARQTLSML
jgi:hypothetical protein